MDARTDAEAVACSFTSPASFGELFDRHATTMFRYFVRSVGPDDADSLKHSPRFAAHGRGRTPTAGASVSRDVNRTRGRPV
jgi:hypothetical protein